MADRLVSTVLGSTAHSAQAETPGPQTECAFYKAQKPVWDMLDTLLAGTNAMRRAREDYLPKFQYEQPTNYESRLKMTTLLNYYKRTVLGLVGKPFSKPVVVPEEMPEDMTDMFENIDKQGNDLSSFARNVFRTGVAKGIVHILVDYPTMKNEDGEAPKTLADEKAVGAQPYMICIQPENLIAAFADMVDGVEVLTHVRIKECEVVRHEWEEVLIERVRVLEPGKWFLYKKGSDNKYALEDEGETTLDVIPLVTFYAEREGFMTSRPPLLDLAHLNVSHWQSSSDQRNVLSVARFPILGASGVDPESKLEIGPNSFFAIRDVQSKLYYVEHSGAAIGAGRQDLEDLKAEMAMLGLQLLAPQQSGGTTATAKAMDGAEANCGLQSMVLDFQTVLNSAIELMQAWKGDDAEYPDVTINSDFGLTPGQAQDLSILLAMRAARDISHTAFMEEMIRRGLLSADFDIEADKELADEEPKPEPTGFGFGSRFGGKKPAAKDDAEDPEADPKADDKKIPFKKAD